MWRCWQDGVPYELARHRAAQQYITVTIPSPSGDRVDVPATQRMAGDALDPAWMLALLRAACAQRNLRCQESGAGAGRQERPVRAERSEPRSGALDSPNALR